MQTQLAVCGVIINPVWSAAVSAQQHSIYRFHSQDKKSAAGSMRESALHSAFCLAKNANFISTFFLHACGGLAAAVAGVIAFYLLLTSPRSRYKVMPAPGRLLSMRLSRARVQKPDNTSCVELSSAGGGCLERSHSSRTEWRLQVNSKVLKVNPVYMWH